MTFTITWHCALLIIASFVIIIMAIKKDEETRGMYQGCMTIIAILFLFALWLIYGGIYWW